MPVLSQPQLLGFDVGGAEKQKNLLASALRAD